MDAATELLYTTMKALLWKNRDSALVLLRQLRDCIKSGEMPDVPQAIWELQKEPLPGWKGRQ